MAETSTIATINAWYQTPLGMALLKSELAGLANVLPQIFGYYIVQIGGPNEILLTSPINNRIIINQDTSTPNDALAVKCQLDELPFLPESIDIVLLFHILEFSQKPISILQEVYTTLIPNGYVIIFGFNPCSLWGLTSLWKKSKEIPWIGSWISPKRMRQSLDKIGFNIGDYKSFYFRPPKNNGEQLLFLEGIGQIFWPYCGATYMFVAQKTVAGLTPIKPLLSFIKYFKTPKILPKPTASSNQCNKNQHI